MNSLALPVTQRITLYAPVGNPSAATMRARIISAPWRVATGWAACARWA